MLKLSKVSRKHQAYGVGVDHFIFMADNGVSKTEGGCECKSQVTRIMICLPPLDPVPNMRNCESIKILSFILSDRQIHKAC